MLSTVPPGGIIGITLPSSATQASRKNGPSADIISSTAGIRSLRSITRFDGMPYAEASNARTIAGTGENRSMLAKETNVYKKYQNVYGTATRELFAQFFIRISAKISEPSSEGVS